MNTCKRKVVNCTIINHIGQFTNTKNGPTQGHQCSNEVGNCGCAHAEPRAIIAALKSEWYVDCILVCDYSPCSNCANIIIDSGIVTKVGYNILTEHDKRGVKLLKNSGIKVSGDKNEITRWLLDCGITL